MSYTFTACRTDIFLLERIASIARMILASRDCTGMILLWCRGAIESGGRGAVESASLDGVRRSMVEYVSRFTVVLAVF